MASMRSKVKESDSEKEEGFLAVSAAMTGPGFHNQRPQ